MAELSCPPCFHGQKKGDTEAYVGTDVVPYAYSRSQSTATYSAPSVPTIVKSLVNIPIQWTSDVLHIPVHWLTSVRLLVQSTVTDVYTLTGFVAAIILGGVLLWTVRSHATVLTLATASVAYALIDVRSFVHPAMYVCLVVMALYAVNDAVRCYVTTVFRETIGDALTPRRHTTTAVAVLREEEEKEEEPAAPAMDTLRKVVLLWHADFTVSPKARPDWEAIGTHALPSKKGCNKPELLEACRLLGVSAEETERVKALEDKAKRGFEAVMRRLGVTSATLFV